MQGNTFGRVFRVTAAGESYGPALQIIVDGVPPGVPSQRRKSSMSSTVDVRVRALSPLPAGKKTRCKSLQGSLTATRPAHPWE